MVRCHDMPCSACLRPCQLISMEVFRTLSEHSLRGSDTRETILKRAVWEYLRVHASGTRVLRYRTMPPLFTHTLDTPSFKGSLSLNTGLFINGRFVDPIRGGSIDINLFHENLRRSRCTATGQVITSVRAGTKEDVDLAVKAAKEAYKTSWGLKVPGVERGRLLLKLADLVEANVDELAALESLNIGRPFTASKSRDIGGSIDILRYFGGWADKIHGKTIETNENKFAYTRHEPYGAVGQIIPWNVPLVCLLIDASSMVSVNSVMCPSELTPLTAQKLAELIIEAGFPPGTEFLSSAFGHTVGQAISEHPQIMKIAFTGSTATGRRVQEASAKSNLKAVSLELGGKSPNIIFDDADINQAIQWASSAVFHSAGQMCSAGSRILVQEGIYDEFVDKLAKSAKYFATTKGDPFDIATQHMPQVSEVQLKRVLGYIDIAEKEGARVLVGGTQMGSTGYYFEPALIAADNNMRIAREEIFGPVACIIKFKTEEEAIGIANDTEYGLAAGIFTQNNARAIRMAHALEAGMAFVNEYNNIDCNIPFGGYKQSGIGRENSEYALAMYTQVKAVHINIGLKL
ncbi:aldehyde dehydrogenase [Mucidula mucida]|nr:aldehyde dehydrogenase [Mucidula mucida]